MSTVFPFAIQSENFPLRLFVGVSFSLSLSLNVLAASQRTSIAYRFRSWWSFHASIIDVWHVIWPSLNENSHWLQLDFSHYRFNADIYHFFHLIDQIIIWRWLLLWWWWEIKCTFLQAPEMPIICTIDYERKKKPNDACIVLWLIVTWRLNPNHSVSPRNCFDFSYRTRHITAN